MIIVDHRRNTLAQIRETPPRFGAEIDLRNHGQEIIVTHDPFVTEGDTLEAWLAHYHHAFLIANVKEEGMEQRLTALFAQHKIENFFLLDESFPFIRKFALQGMPQFAVRVSEFESAETALALAADLKKQNKHVDWIWLDTFTGNPAPAETVRQLQGAGYKICFVSAELHHVADPASWERRASAFIATLKSAGLKPDMVCTKLGTLWEEAFAA